MRPQTITPLKTAAWSSVQTSSGGPASKLYSTPPNFGLALILKLLTLLRTLRTKPCTGVTQTQRICRVGSSRARRWAKLKCKSNCRACSQAFLRRFRTFLAAVSTSRFLERVVRIFSSSSFITSVASLTLLSSGLVPDDVIVSGLKDGGELRHVISCSQRHSGQLL